MGKYFKALSTLIAGTIGVGFFAIPYSVQQFGTFWGIVVLVFAAILIGVVNLVYVEIIVTDKGNRQIPGYTRKYIGEKTALFISVIIILGLLGVLLAYSILAGNSLHLLFSKAGLFLSKRCLAVVFVVFGLFVARYGVAFISKISSVIIVVLLLIMGVIVAVAVPDIELGQATSLEISNFSLVFGVSLFALYSAAAIPVIDEVIGYDRKAYRRLVITSVLVTALIYIVFGLSAALSLGTAVSNDFIAGFSKSHPALTTLIVLFSLLAVFSSFVLVANSIKEIFIYDYKVPKKTTILFIAGVLIWLVMLQIGSFEGVISLVGNVALGIQSIVVLAMWFRIKIKRPLWMRLVVIATGAIFLLGIVMHL